MTIDITWKKIFWISIISFFVLIISVLIADGILFSKKDDVLKKLYISENVKASINRIVLNQESIVGIQVVTINFQTNSRHETYIKIDNPLVQQIYDKFISSSIVATPLFDETEKNNQRIIRLINGEFVCIPFSDSAAYKYGPAAGEYVKHVCAIGIPPYSLTDFTGILTIYLNAEPDEKLREKIFFFARDTSLAIAYENNYR